MSTKVKCDASIKTRVPSEIKDAMLKLARARSLDLADIARESFREFLARPESVRLISNGKNGRHA